MTFIEVCSVFTLPLSFLLSISAFSNSRAKHSRSSTRAIHSLDFFSSTIVTSSNSFFNVSTCLLQDPRWFPAYSSCRLVSSNWSPNLWLSSFNCRSSSSSRAPAVPSISLLSIFFCCSSILCCISLNSPTLIVALSTTFGGCSCVSGTTYLLVWGYSNNPIHLVPDYRPDLEQLG